MKGYSLFTADSEPFPARYASISHKPRLDHPIRRYQDLVPGPIPLNPELILSSGTLDPEEPAAMPDRASDRVLAGPEPETPDGPPGNSDSLVNRPRPDPTRYGDWEKAGRCIDF